MFRALALLGTLLLVGCLDPQPSAPAAPESGPSDAATPIASMTPVVEPAPGKGRVECYGWIKWRGAEISVDDWEQPEGLGIITGSPAVLVRGILTTPTATHAMTLSIRSSYGGLQLGIEAVRPKSGDASNDAGLRAAARDLVQAWVNLSEEEFDAFWKTFRNTMIIADDFENQRSETIVHDDASTHWDGPWPIDRLLRKPWLELTEEELVSAFEQDRFPGNVQLKVPGAVMQAEIPSVKRMWSVEATEFAAFGDVVGLRSVSIRVRAADNDTAMEKARATFSIDPPTWLGELPWQFAFDACFPLSE